LERVARLRDELHATANRVARFAVDDLPIVDPARTTTPTDASMLAPEQVLSRLELTAGRLITLLEPLSAREWARTGRMGDRLVTLGEIVDRVVHGAAHDLLDLLGSTAGLVPVGPPRPQRRAGPGSKALPPVPRISLARKVSRDGAAS
jgi:hypothetical protein